MNLPQAGARLTASALRRFLVGSGVLFVERMPNEARVSTPQWEFLATSPRNAISKGIWRFVEQAPRPGKPGFVVKANSGTGNDGAVEDLLVIVRLEDFVPLLLAAQDKERRGD